MNSSKFYGQTTKRWDDYFLTLCNAVAAKSPCLSRQIGAIIVRDYAIVSTGYNGPARGFPHCIDQCKRKVMGYKSGEGLVHCPAAHAELNCIAQAARNGVSVRDTTLYLNTNIPCKDCMIAIVNAGITEVVSINMTPYHELSISIAAHGGVRIRRFSE